jgi:hypothetical protein
MPCSQPCELARAIVATQDNAAEMTQPLPDETPQPAIRSRGWETWLGDDSHFWWLATGVFGVIAALKGLRAPGAWALTQAQLDYSHGLLKRGLLGTIYGTLGMLQRRPLSVIFFAELALLVVLLAVFTRRTGIVERFGTPAVVALFAGSYVVTYLFHIVGYTDIPNAAIAIGLLLIRNARIRFLAALPLFAVALLIHENFLFLFVPMVLLSFYLDGSFGRIARRAAWSFGIVLALVACGVTLLTSLRPLFTDVQVDAYAATVRARADFPVRDDFFQVLSISPSDNLQMMSDDGWHHYLWWTYQAVALCVYLPLLLLLLHFCMRLLRAGSPALRADKGTATSPGSPPRSTRLAVLLAIFSPLTLHLLGLDQVRWNTWVVVDAYLALGLLARQMPGMRFTLSKGERNAVVLAIAIGMASGYGLFDGATVNPYPFFPRPLWPTIQRHDGVLPGF